jgi:hypothetical protein
MAKLEQRLRVIAALLGLSVLALSVCSIFRRSDPVDQRLDVIAVRIIFFAVLAAFFFRRAIGTKMEPVSWGMFAVFTIGWIAWFGNWVGAVASAVCTALASAGAFLELRRERAAQPGVEPDGPSARGLTP